MKLLLATAVMATALGLAQPQCFSKQDDFSQPINTSLAGITDFGFDLYRQLAPPESPENFFFSPHSIWSAFTLTSFGTAGETDAQLRRVLRLEGKEQSYNKWRALDGMYKRRQHNTTDYTFTSANSVFLDNTLPVRTCIFSLLHSEVEKLNFKDTANALRKINGFASRNTNGLIPEIVTLSDLRDVEMVLANAAYFKGTWKYQFQPTNTFQAEFNAWNQPPQKVPMMVQTTSFRYGEFHQIAASVIELPYTGDAMSMFVFLPSQEGPQGFANMVSRLSGQNLRAATYKGNMGFREVELRLPKFKMEVTVPQSNMKKGLQNLGVTDIFDPRKVDLTDFGPLRNLTLDKVIHKAFVEVNEEGTEAAAVTALLFATRSGGPRRLPVEFFCDRPFLFLIRDNDTHNILFMGAYKDPSKL